MSVDLRVQMPDPDPWEAFLYRKQKDTGEPTPVYLGAWPPDEYYLKVALWWEEIVVHHLDGNGNYLLICTHMLYVGYLRIHIL